MSINLTNGWNDINPGEITFDNEMRLKEICLIPIISGRLKGEYKIRVSYDEDGKVSSIKYYDPDQGLVIL